LKTVRQAINVLAATKVDASGMFGERPSSRSMQQNAAAVDYGSEALGVC